MDINISNVTDIIFNNKSLTKLILNDTLVWEKKITQKYTVKFYKDSTLIDAVEVEYNKTIGQTSSVPFQQYQAYPEYTDTNFLGFFDKTGNPLNVNYPYNADKEFYVVSSSKFVTANPNLYSVPSDILSLDNIDVRGKNVLVCINLSGNVDELDNDFILTVKEALEQSYQTINYLLNDGANRIAIGYYSRTNGSTVMPVAIEVGQAIAEVFNLSSSDVSSLFDSADFSTKFTSNNSKFVALQIWALDNYNLDRSRNMAFAQALANGVDIYITDFAEGLTLNYASTALVPTMFPDKAIGFNISSNSNPMPFFGFSNAQRPIILLSGSIPLSSYLPGIFNLLSNIEYIYISSVAPDSFGANYLKYMGYNTDVDENTFSAMPAILTTIDNKGVKVIIPQDFVTTNADYFTSSTGFYNATMQIKTMSQLGTDTILGIGPASINSISNDFAKAIYGKNPTVIDLVEDGSDATDITLLQKIIYDSAGQIKLQIVGSGDNIISEDLIGATTSSELFLIGLEGNNSPAMEALK